MAQVAPSVAASPVPTSGNRDHQPRAREARVGASLPPLPSWANTNQARAILRAVMAEKPGVRECDGTIGIYFQYVGKSAAQLRNLWGKTYVHLVNWASAAPHGSELYEQRRAGVIAYAKAFNSDAVIARCLGEALTFAGPDPMKGARS